MYCFNARYFRSVADRFGINKSVCWNILYRTCFKILEMNKLYGIIRFPTGNRAQEVITGFHAINGFPVKLSITKIYVLPLFKSLSPSMASIYLIMLNLCSYYVMFVCFH